MRARIPKYALTRTEYSLPIHLGSLSMMHVLAASLGHRSGSGGGNMLDEALSSLLQISHPPISTSGVGIA